jgi:hypothetical protein
MRRIKLFSFTVFLLILEGCAQPTSPPSPTPTALVLPTEVNTATSIPTLVLPTSTALPLPTATVLPTPDLSGLTVLGSGPSNGNYLFNFQIPAIDRVYLVTVDGIPYKCEILTQYENRLMCYGLMLDWGKTVKIQFTDPKSNQIVYQLSYQLPDHDYGFGTPAPPVCVNPYACPQRGQNMHCETELHYDSEGKPCMVATCTDACGFCVGIQTCNK